MQFVAGITPDVFDERDIKRVRESDTWLRHFLLHKKYQVADAVKMMKTTLAWRKEFGVNDITEESISLEARKLGACYFHNQNLSGNDIYYFCIKLNKKGDSEHNKNARLMIAYMLDNYQRRKPLQRVVALLDMTAVGVTNVDMDLTKFLITCFTSYFPGMLEYLLVYDMPWIINTVWAVIKLMLSEEEQKHVIFCKKSNIQQYVASSQLPRHMGGTDTYKYRYVDSVLDISDDEEFQDSEDLPAGGDNEERVPSPAPISSLPDIAQQVPSTSSAGAVPKKQVNWAATDQVKEYSLTPSPTVEESTFPNAEESAEAVASSSLKPSSYRITIVPTSELQFTRPGINQDASCSIKLTNDQQVTLAYKVRTTDPKNYKVKQGRGMLLPGNSDVVHVTLLAGQEIKRDKFLVLSTKLNSDNMNPRELAAFWKSINKSQIHEHKLRCHEAALDLDASVSQLVTEAPSLTTPVTSSSKSLPSDAVSQLEGRLATLEDHIFRLNWLLKTVVSLLVLVIAMIAFK
ncbi:motile sperm domain-containing protein 2-like isoform X2 [Watersipora subatra]|uniref:motile sperm domain-containing protein 2-like isoform X2 n=1 Tax=Watersipora subatra TaxID=2589382 RepID=UPI00355C56CB